MKRTATPFFGGDIGDGFGEVQAVAVKILGIVLAFAGSGSAIISSLVEIFRCASAALRILLLLASGWECPGRRLSRA